MMFKDSLKNSFDAISPSPELLDSVSAMMKEEYHKKSRFMKADMR